MTAEDHPNQAGPVPAQVLKPRLVFEPLPDGLSATLVSRAETLANDKWTNLTEAVLHAHLLLEQALTERIRRKLLQPDVLDNSRLPRLGFAQMITIYAGLYAPDPDDLRRLLAFNRLRNRIAHTLDDPEVLIIETLRAATPESSEALPGDLFRWNFFYLFFGELLGIKAVHAHDPDAQRTGASRYLNDDGEQVCRICGKR